MGNELAHPSENKRVQRTAPEREKALANGRVLSATHEQPSKAVCQLTAAVLYVRLSSAALDIW